MSGPRWGKHEDPNSGDKDPTPQPYNPDQRPELPADKPDDAK
ncbi:hypothetical protein [Spongiactinospora gelatinilytica]|nr:hypothetical protein [Spongiactinospora gelatinilytica]